MFIRCQNGQLVNLQFVASIDVDVDEERAAQERWQVQAIREDDEYYPIATYPTEEQARQCLEAIKSALQNRDLLLMQ